MADHDPIPGTTWTLKLLVAIVETGVLSALSEAHVWVTGPEDKLHERRLHFTDQCPTALIHAPRPVTLTAWAGALRAEDPTATRATPCTDCLPALGTTLADMRDLGDPDWFLTHWLEEAADLLHRHGAPLTSPVPAPADPHQWHTGPGYVFHFPDGAALNPWFTGPTASVWAHRFHGRHILPGWGTIPGAGPAQRAAAEMVLDRLDHAYEAAEAVGLIEKLRWGRYARAATYLHRRLNGTDTNAEVLDHYGLTPETWPTLLSFDEWIWSTNDRQRGNNPFPVTIEDLRTAVNTAAAARPVWALLHHNGRNTPDSSFPALEAERTGRVTALDKITVLAAFPPLLLELGDTDRYEYLSADDGYTCEEVAIAHQLGGDTTIADRVAALRAARH